MAATRRAGFAAALLTAACLALAAGCSDDEPPTASNERSGDQRGAGADGTVTQLDADMTLDDTALYDTALYDTALDGNGEPGDPIALQRVEVPGLDGRAWRILYRSRSAAGRDIAVSGVLAVPTGPAPSAGRPMLAWAHGTAGLADRCAPSREPADALALAAPFLARGMVFVATDYEGLGTPGLHPYLFGESEGRSVLDAARAAHRLGDLTDASDKTVVWGHSQGGHAALFARELAASWAPELDLLGTVAGAPPSQLRFIAPVLGSSPAAYYLAMVAGGWNAADPTGDPSLVLSREAQSRLGLLERECGPALARSFADLTGGALLAADPATVPPWSDLLDRNEPGTRTGTGPVLIVHGEADTLIPPSSSELLARRMCSLGEVVQRRTYAGATHVSVVADAKGDISAWVEARLRGEPATGSC